MDRRTFLAATATAVAATGCARIVHRVAGRQIPEDPTPPPKSQPTRRLLERTGFGPAPGDIQRVSEMGHAAYLAEQLNPGDDDPALVFLLSRLDVNRVHASELRDLPEAHVLRQLRQSALLAAVYSKWQLRERMVDFWNNHFNIDQAKNYGTFRIATDNLKVVRAHALGSFPEMVKTSAHSSAMLGYLDNQLNKKGVANENYARELLELHTLGVHGGYTQKDVMEVARCFTGWGIENRFLRQREGFLFNPDFHDDGEKTVLGHRIAPKGGVKDAEQVLDIVTLHPMTAKHIAGKLCKHFLGSADDPAGKDAAAAFLSTKGDIKATMRPILASPNLLDGPPVVKRPFDFLVSALRAVGSDTDAGPALLSHLEAMGQPHFGWPMPDGYPDRTSAWTGSLLARWNFAYALAAGRIDGTTTQWDKVGPHVASLVLGNHGPVHAAKDLVERAAACLSAPEFQWR